MLNCDLCSRYIWLSTVLLTAFVGPSVKLIQTLPHIAAIKSAVYQRLGLVDNDIRNIVRASQWEKVAGMSAALTVFVFGTLVPPLLVVGVLVPWLNYSCSQHIAGDTCGINTFLLLSPPTSQFRKIGYIGCWFVACLTFIDLQFAYPPMILYGVLNLLVLFGPQTLQCCRSKSCWLVHQKTGTGAAVDQLQKQIDNLMIDVYMPELENPNRPPPVESSPLEPSKMTRSTRIGWGLERTGAPHYEGTSLEKC